MTDVPAIDVHAHVLLPGVDQAVAGQPGLLAAREFDARGSGAASLTISGPMVAARFTLLTDVSAGLAAMDGFDSVVHSPAVLRSLLDAVGPDRVLLGSDFPFDMGTEDPLGDMRAAGLTESDFRAIRGGNAANLLGLSRA